MENQNSSQKSSQSKPNIWTDWIKGIMQEQFMKDLANHLSEESLNHTILPGNDKVFRAFELTPYHETKIVILGQDPYPNKIDATGLAFSSASNEIPKSLKVIFEEIRRSMYSHMRPEDSERLFLSPNLDSWAKQGVLLINSLLTVREGQSESHKNIGWEQFTKRVITKLNDHPDNLVFMFWGRKAQQYMDGIDLEKHLVLTSPHPAAQLYDSSQKFVGNGHFFEAIKFIEKYSKAPQKSIDLDIDRFIDKKGIMEYVFDTFSKYQIPNELGNMHDKQAMTKQEAIEKLFKYKETFEITNYINWRTT